jgi:hypothetical protein
MGDAGSLFLGFLLMAVAIRAGQPLTAPASLVVPLLIVALPLADTITVFLGRLRHGRSPLRGGRDHLSHRLAGTGLGSARAVVVLIGVEGALSALAVAAGRQRLPLWLAASAGAVIILSLVVVTARVRVYPDDPVGLPRVLVWGIPGGVIVLGALAVPSALGMLRAHRPVLAAETDLENALAAAHSGQLSLVTSDLAQARQHLQQAHADLHGPLTSTGLAYPVLSSNLAAARAMVATGLNLSDLGGQLTALRQDLHLQIKSGTLPLPPLEHAAAGLRLASASVDRSAGQVSHLSRTYLLPPVAHALTRFQSDLGPAQRDLSNASAIATNLPDMLGARGPRTYFLAVQNPDESRGTGGLIGNWGLLVADNGHNQVGTFSREEQLDATGGAHRSIHANAAYLARYSIFDPAHNWQNINMSPDFPTVGSVIADLYPQSGGPRIDGVIAVDPATLRALLQITGPVAVSGWPVPLDASNVVPVTLYDAYNTYRDETQRADFLSNVAHAAFSAFQSLNLTDVSNVVSALGPVARQGDVMVYSTHPAEEAFLQQVDVAGAVPPVHSASLDVVTQNVAANKIDYFLHRSIDYRATITPEGPSTAQSSVQLTVGLDNNAPPGGLPPSLIGPYSSQFKPGEEATYLNIYTPLDFESARLNGSAAAMSSARELGRNVYSDFIDISSGQRSTLEMSLTGPVSLLPGGWLVLDIPHQPVVNPDRVAVEIDVPNRWQITGVRGASRTGPQQVVAHFVQTADDSVWVRVAPARGS